MFTMSCTPVQNTINTTTSEVYVSASQDDVLLKSIEEETLESEQEIKTSQQLLETALKFAQGGSSLQSKNFLKRINPEELNDVSFLNYSLLESKVSNSEDELNVAFQKLESNRILSIEKNLNDEALIDLYKEKSAIALTLGELKTSIQYDVKLHNLISSKEIKSKLHNETLAKLISQPYKKLQQCKNNADLIVGAWCDLGLEIRDTQLNFQTRADAYQNWRERYPDHSAAQFAVIPSYVHDAQTEKRQIALLLPLEGEYLSPSKNFIEGFLNGYFNSLKRNEDNRQTIKIFNSSEDGILNSYQDAMKLNPQIIIGGFRQSEAKDLLSLETYEVPTIILNDFDQLNYPERENLFFFSNSQGDEISHIISDMWYRGIQSVIVITPDHLWGLQASEAFQSGWVARGGIILDTVIFNQDTRDFTDLLKRPLHIDTSEKRGLFLKRFVNSKLDLSSRRRNDIDGIVLFAYSDKARQIKPALNYLFANDIPVYSSSRIYNDVEEPNLYRDLDDIKFAGMPWSLEGSLQQELNIDETLHPEYRQLYTRGFDSFLLSQNLREPSFAQNIPLLGATGVLRLKNNMVTKDPYWYQFKNGSKIKIQAMKSN